MTKEIIFWLLVSLQSIGAIASILRIGQQRESYTKEYAVANVVVSIIYVWLYYILKS